MRDFSSDATVTSVSRKPTHSPSKSICDEIRLIEGLGVEGDAHCGQKVKHRSRVRQNPDQPNLRQVHLIHSELHDELRARGFEVTAGIMGENVTTRGVDLLSLPRGTRLQLGNTAVIELTGLRNPCSQLDSIQTGLMEAVLDRDEEGRLVRKSGVMGVVVSGGVVRAGDRIEVRLPTPPYRRLDRV
ncbi:MAG: MOSC domain-containing protein [Thermoanaerobaculia bacterium]|nr:MOSC domain-containing protein [Thermoanaerobaculia bacterium]